MKVLTGVQIVWDPDHSDVSCGDGWDKNPLDLNEGADGWYIYLCMQWTDEQIVQRDGLSPIRDLYILVDSPDAPEGFIPILKDLNKGAGGSYLYLCYSTTSGGEPITDIQLRIADHASQLGQIQRYKQLRTDLNKDAGGPYINLYYKKG